MPEQDKQATEKQFAEMAKIVEHFKGKPRTQNAIIEYCNLNKFEYIPTVEDLEDLEFQVEHDEKMVSMFKQILAELQKMEYVPMLLSKGEKKKLVDANDEVRVNITKIFENNGVSFKMIDKVANELGGMIAKTVESAGTTAFNKAMDVLMHIARAHFGGDFTMKHARDYAIEVFEKHHAEKQEKSAGNVPSSEVPTPENSGEPQEENGAGDR